MKGFMTARFLWLAAAVATGGIFALGVRLTPSQGHDAAVAGEEPARLPQTAAATAPDPLRGYPGAGAGTPAEAVQAGEFANRRVRVIRDGRGRIRQVRDEGGVTISLTYRRDGSLERREATAQGRVVNDG